VTSLLFVDALSHYPGSNPKGEDGLTSRPNRPKAFLIVPEFVSKRGLYAPPFNGVLPVEYSMLDMIDQDLGSSPINIALAYLFLGMRYFYCLSQ
jgi:hypothetical protein